MAKSLRSTVTTFISGNALVNKKITHESNMKVMRIEEMITNQSSSWLRNKFSLSASLEMYKEQYGEYAY